MDLMATYPATDSQTANTLSWNYSNIEPFESREILVTMKLNAPTDTPPLNGGEILDFVATIDPVTGDETTGDNTLTLNQKVVNSFDPNDKTCIEGERIIPEMVGDYVHYLIRFENTGTASAINVIVKDIIDMAKFDPTTLNVTDSSHHLKTRITNGNEVEFVFENINLPFEDANNDGYIAFKIKTLESLVLGDTFENEAEIYFDYNFPIVTNRTITTVANTVLSIEETAIVNFEIYPNPVKDRLFINGIENIESVTIYDISGRTVKHMSNLINLNRTEISTQHLSQGAYFVKIKAGAGELVQKVTKR